MSDTQGLAYEIFDVFAEAPYTGNALAVVHGGVRLDGATMQARDARNRLAARMFAPDLGVSEDPATGSAAGWLGAYLARHPVLGSGDFDARVEQGHELGRPSLLHLRARGGGAALRISVGGRVLPVARGELA